MLCGPLTVLVLQKPYSPCLHDPFELALEFAACGLITDMEQSIKLLRSTKQAMLVITVHLENMSITLQTVVVSGGAGAQGMPGNSTFSQLALTAKPYKRMLPSMSTLGQASSQVLTERLGTLPILMIPPADLSTEIHRLPEYVQVKWG